MMRILAILTILTTVLQNVYSQEDACVLQLRIPCTIMQWGVDQGKSCFDEVTGKSNIVRPVKAETCREVSVRLRYTICKGSDFDQRFILNPDKTWGKLRGENVELTMSSIPEGRKCVSTPIFTSINTCDNKTPFSLYTEATTSEGSYCHRYKSRKVEASDSNQAEDYEPIPCELQTSISCTIKEGDNLNKPCEDNIFYERINPTICNPISVEYKYEICKGNTSHKGIPYYFNGKRTSATLRVSDKNDEMISLDESPLSETCRSTVVTTTIEACQGPVTALLDARAHIGVDDPVCSTTSRLDIIPRVEGELSSAPSAAPTTSPAPSTSGSPSVDCSTNDWNFREYGRAGRGCAWVGQRPRQRCLISTGAKQACAKSCCGYNDA